VSEALHGARGAHRALIVWWFRERQSEQDGQVRGLLKALEAYAVLRIYAAPVVDSWKAWRFALHRYYPAAELPAPDILIGVGRDTHWSMLAARWARGGRIVTLCKPRLPRWWFNLCVVPAHAGGRNSKRVIATRGVLPPPSAAHPKAAATGLILIGGPNPHYRWSDEEMLGRIGEILARHPDHRWYVVTTTHTPAETERRVQALSAPAVFAMAHHETDPKWLLARIQDAEQVWVSEDQLAVIYQALTAGAAVGVLPVPRTKPSREVAALEGLVVFFPQWQSGTPLQAPQPPFNESARCAAEIHQRWLSDVA
jgi:mitochondrial fission protein ELM1